ncbi:hypothetical protein H4582DRAFT_831945 [Lactarius indigo]|nr:hypothetical protein H4582DRAFT_831945 [Lactarius indigo]
MHSHPSRLFLQRSPPLFSTICVHLSDRQPRSLHWAEGPDHLAWLRVVHVCHHWREIALNQPLFWSHINFTTFNSAGAAEILARAKTVPLYLEAKVPIGLWDDGRFSVLQKELQARVLHICHLSISAEPLHLPQDYSKDSCHLLPLLSTFRYPERVTGTEQYHRKYSSPTLFSMAPPLGSLTSSSTIATSVGSRRSWKGLKYLDLRVRFAGVRPSLSDWLDALDKMPQLETLTLHSTFPIAPPGALLPSRHRTHRHTRLPCTLKYLRLCKRLWISTSLISSSRLSPSCVSWQHPIAKTVVTCKKSSHMLPDMPMDPRILNPYSVWSSAVIELVPTCLRGTLPNIDVKMPNPIAFLGAMFPARVDVLCQK